MKKKAVITILGIQGGYVDNEKANFTDPDNIARYVFNSKSKEYFNTFPLLIDVYSQDYEIVPIFTKDAKIFNKTVLEKYYPDISCDFKNKYMIEDEKNFKEVFALFNHTIDNFDEVIIDVTHGFRHLPLLMLIDLLIINFKDINKIKHIWFAKEDIKHIKGQQGKYEVIDLKEYLELANISYALSSFSQNYTISKKINTSNKLYNDFLEELNNFSEHILANSLDALFLSENKDKKSIVNRLIELIDKIIENKNDILHNFEPFLLEVKQHLEKIKDYSRLQDFEKMYELSNNMLEKGYLLNAITLLHEAIGLYCKEEFKKISPEIKEFIGEFESKVKNKKNISKKYQLYSLTDQSKNLYKLSSDYIGDYLHIKYPRKNEHDFNKKARTLTIKIKNYLIDLEENEIYKKQKEIIDKISILRNNLAHGNSSKRLADVEEDINTVLKDFKNYFLKSIEPNIPPKKIVKDFRKKRN